MGCAFYLVLLKKNKKTIKKIIFIFLVAYGKVSQK
jgi:hypothetical protein